MMCSEVATKYPCWTTDGYQSQGLTMTRRKRAATTGRDSGSGTAIVTASWTHCPGPGFEWATATWRRVVEKMVMRVIKLDLVNCVQRAGVI